MAAATVVFGAGVHQGAPAGGAAQFLVGLEAPERIGRNSHPRFDLDRHPARAEIQENVDPHAVRIAPEEDTGPFPVRTSSNRPRGSSSASARR